MKSESFRAFVEELFEPVEGASVRLMFGGLGIFREGIMFALGADETLYFRSDGETDPAFLAEGSQAWVYQGRDRAVTMPYRRVPERLLDDREEFRTWALAAFAAAQRAKVGKPKAKSGTKVATRAKPKVNPSNPSKTKPPAGTRAKSQAAEKLAKAKPRSRAAAGGAAKASPPQAKPRPAASKGKARPASKSAAKARRGG